MAETTIRIGIIGCADIARKLARAIALCRNATVSAIGSRSVEKAKRFAEENDLPLEAKIYGSYEAVLDDPEVDAVYVPLPTNLHAKWAAAAAQKGKHVLLEKPVAMNVADLDVVLGKCRASNVQFMDATMWMHHPRTAKMKELLSEMGPIQVVTSCLTHRASPDFLHNNIRVKPDLEALGVLGDTGWYCVRAILWVNNYELPKQVRASNGAVFNNAGVLLSCAASLLWEDGRVASFHCSFLGNLCTDITAIATRGTLHVHDFVVPVHENEACFSVSFDGGFKEITGGKFPVPSNHAVGTELPQETLMVEEFARLAGKIKNNEGGPEELWPTLSRKTQLVLDAVMASIHNGFKEVAVGN